MVVELTCWGEKAEEMSDELLDTHPVIAVKGVKVSEFGGRTLNSSFNSTFHINPAKLPEADMLRVWYDDKGKDAQVESISTQGGGGKGGKGDPRKQMVDIEGERLGYNEKPDYFTVLGTVLKVRGDPTKPPYYPSCPSEGCNKKVVQDESRGAWTCEKCDKSFGAPVYRYILGFNAQDASGDYWLTAFNEVAEVLVGNSAENVNNFLAKEGNEKKYKAALNGALFKHMVLKCRAKADVNPKDGETRVRCHVLSAYPANYASESKSLLDEISTYDGAADVAMVA